MPTALQGGALSLAVDVTLLSALPRVARAQRSPRPGGKDPHVVGGREEGVSQDSVSTSDLESQSGYFVGKPCLLSLSPFIYRQNFCSESEGRSQVTAGSNRGVIVTCIYTSLAPEAGHQAPGPQGPPPSARAGA